MILSSTPNVSNVELGLYQPFPIIEQSLVGIWQLRDKTLIGKNNQPLTLEFNNTKVSVVNGCNNIMANYQIDDYRLTVSSPISTRMACEKNLMALDNLAVKLLKGEIILEKFVGSLPEHAYIKITANGKDYKFSKVK